MRKNKNGLQQLTDEKRALVELSHAYALARRAWLDFELDSSLPAEEFQAQSAQEENLSVEFSAAAHRLAVRVVVETLGYRALLPEGK